MNTIWGSRAGTHDALRTRGDLEGWLAATGLSVGTVRDDDVTAFRELRDALRCLAALLTADERPHAASPLQDVDLAVRQVNAAASASPFGPRLQRAAEGLDCDDRPGNPTEALSAAAAQAVGLLTGDAARLLRACQAPGCVLYYVRQHPRRSWCSNACGNRARAASHYRRHRSAPDR